MQTPIPHDEVHAGHYVWRHNADAKKHIVLVVDDDHGQHIRRFDGTFSEALYGDFLNRIDL